MRFSIAWFFDFKGVIKRAWHTLKIKKPLPQKGQGF
jgi:hypothetical protein